MRYASGAEWKDAASIELVRRGAFTTPADLALMKELRFRRTKPEGPHKFGADARISAEGRYIAVNSWDGTQGEGEPYWEWHIRLWPEKGAKGEIFVDVFDTKSGALQFSLQGKFRGYVDFLGAFLDSAWMDDRYYFLPVDRRHLNQFVLCDVARLSNDKQVNFKPIRLSSKGKDK